MKAHINDDTVDASYVPETSHGKTSSNSSWDAVTVLTPTNYKTGKGYTKTTPKRGNDEMKDKSKMESQPDPAVLEGDQGPGDQARDPQGQGPQQRAVKFDDEAPGDVDGKSSLRPTVVVLRGLRTSSPRRTTSRLLWPRYNVQTTPPTTMHHEHHVQGNESNVTFAGADSYKKFGEGNFDWGDYSFENCERIFEATHYFPEKLNLRKVHDGDYAPPTTRPTPPTGCSPTAASSA